jgi:Ca2+-binding EF-hand superfamily protein
MNSSSWSSSSSYSYSYTSSSGQVSTRAVSLPTDAFDRFMAFTPQRAISQDGFMKVAQVIMMGSNSSDEDIREAFHILDADGSGHLDVSEFAKIIPAILPGSTVETLGEMIRRYDKNFDNQINLKEFTSIIKGGLGRDLVFRDLVMIEYHT